MLSTQRCEGMLYIGAKIMASKNIHINHENDCERALDKRPVNVYNNGVDNDMVLYDVADIQRIFKYCGINQAYSLMNQKGFPSFKFGRKLFVEKSAFEKWLGLQPRISK